MFHRLHRQMTLFCTLVTGSILVIMTVLCLFLSEKSMRETLRQSFLNDVNSIIVRLSSQKTIGHQWLTEMGNGRYILNLYDNGSPLLHNSLFQAQDKAATNRESLCQLAIETAAQQYSLDIFSQRSNRVFPEHREFLLQDSEEGQYFAATLLFPRGEGSLGAVVMLSLAAQNHQFAMQRLLFAGIDLVGIAMLLVFAWFFTKRMLVPLKESREKQVQFVSAASHELRSPLAVMLSNLSAMEKADPQERRQFQETIRTEGNRMARLIDDLLALANADSHSWSICQRPTELDTLALNLYEKYSRPAYEKQVQLTITLPEEGIPPTQCDGDRIEQAVSALISNALSYTPCGGKVELILSQLGGGQMMFTVQDNGPGIPDREKPLIFQRFYRADPSRQDREHFGLGLCVAQEIALLHRGKLWVEDTPGGGACFKLVL